MVEKNITYKEVEMPLWEFFFALPYFNPTHCGIIPPLKHLNTFLMKGSFVESKWNPFEISDEEYNTLVDQLLKPDRRRIEKISNYTWQQYQIDSELANCSDYEQWQQKVKQKHQQTYGLRLAMLQHEMVLAANKNNP